MKSFAKIGLVVLVLAATVIASGVHAAGTAPVQAAGNAWAADMGALQAWVNDLFRQLALIEKLFNERFGQTAAPAATSTPGTANNISAPAAVVGSIVVAPAPASAVGFAIGDRVETTAKVNVRKSPSTSAKSSGKQGSGALGTVVGGPSYDAAGGYWFLDVNFDAGADGWVAENFLQKAIAVTPPPAPTPTPPPPTSEVRINAYTTAYGWPDNTPPGGAISHPVIHQTAGGTGTYADPVTLAVGHSIINGTDILDFPAGTRFYVPNLRRYFIVEDTCGDGNTPQNGPCHSLAQAPAGVTAWVDMWVGGNGTNDSAVLACEDTVTGVHLIIENPASNYAVVSGPVFNGSCSQQYGDTPTN